MKPALKKTESQIYYFSEGRRIDGPHDLISGDVSGLSGDIDACELTDEERAAGVDVTKLVMEVKDGN